MKQNPNDRPAKQTAVFNYELISYAPTPEEWAYHQRLNSVVAYDLSGSVMIEESPFLFDTRSIVHCLTEREPVGGWPHDEDIDAGVKIQAQWAGDEWPAQPFIVLLQQLRVRDALIDDLSDECNRLTQQLEKLKSPLFAGPGPELQEAEPKAKGPFTRDRNRKPVDE